MRRLLTGYALSFNHRHRRHGHVFQNRYKSILCQEDSYLLELVRYIHLNPLRAKLVAGYEQLSKFAWSGHGALAGMQGNDWQDTAAVLQMFAENAAKARIRYLEYVHEGISQGRRCDLTGGGLVRSAGGWQAVRELDMTMTELSRTSGLSIPAISMAVQRGGKLAHEIHFFLPDLINLKT